MHELGWSAQNNLCRLAKKIAPHFYTTYSKLFLDYRRTRRRKTWCKPTLITLIPPRLRRPGYPYRRHRTRLCPRPNELKTGGAISSSFGSASSEHSAHFSALV